MGEKGLCSVIGQILEKRLMAPALNVRLLDT
jgi:hypothetical protein